MTQAAERNIPAITLWQPFASMIAEEFKCIETRTHGGFASLAGQRIAIHAGRTVDWEAWEYLESRFYKGRLGAWLLGHRLPIARGRMRSLLPESAVVATGYVREHRRLTSADAGAACVDNPSGLWGLVLGEIRPVDPPAAARGWQGVWLWAAPEGMKI